MKARYTRTSPARTVVIIVLLFLASFLVGILIAYLESRGLIISPLGGIP